MTRERYLALIGDGQSDPAQIEALGRQAACSSALHVIAADAEFVLLTDAQIRLASFGENRGAILGSIFEQDKSGRPGTAPGTQALETIFASGGHRLMTDFWGGYVAIIRSAADNRCVIVRDPSGFLACYHAQADGITAIASDARLLETIGFIKGTVDWPALHRHLMTPELRDEETCIAGASELLRGHRLTITRGDHAITQLWTPWAFAQPSNQITDYSSASQALASTLNFCVAAWARDFRHILLGVSGGLDSSIVAACLRGSGAAFTCHTISTREPVGDERLQARILAEAVKAPLIEHWYDIADIDITCSHAAQYPRPISRVFAQSLSARSSEAAADVGADAFFSGGGGDNVFSLQRSGAPLADHYLSEGLWAARTTLRHLCDLTDASFVEAVRQAQHYVRRRNQPYVWNVDPDFLSGRDDAGLARNDHPWLHLPCECLPGKARHIAMILRFQNHLEGYRHAELAPKLAPLMSQPVMEQCLKIASWLWLRDGIDRSVARRAFARHLPAEIINRRSKGSPDSFVIAIYQHFRSLIREMLNEGLLAANNLLDLPAVNRALAETGPVRDHHYGRILSLVDAEAWARCWNRR
jgi:asparagine synthase (glutamine-hydrolysing)